METIDEIVGFKNQDPIKTASGFINLAIANTQMISDCTLTTTNKDRKVRETSGKFNYFSTQGLAAVKDNFSAIKNLVIHTLAHIDDRDSLGGLPVQACLDGFLICKATEKSNYLFQTVFQRIKFLVNKECEYLKSNPDKLNSTEVHDFFKLTFIHFFYQRLSGFKPNTDHLKQHFKLRLGLGQSKDEEIKKMQKNITAWTPELLDLYGPEDYQVFQENFQEFQNAFNGTLSEVIGFWNQCLLES